MTKVSGTWLTQAETAPVMDLLVRAGHQAYFVGGCVRDALAGVEVKDIDVSTDARPTRVMELAETAGMKAIPTGIDHGTVTLVSGAVPYEVTTFRRDVETDGRRAVVAFADTMEDDALRRDFTMNALYARGDGTVLDPTGTGITDLAEGRVRFVGNATARIREDYLRTLRYFRFHARFGHSGPDPEALSAIADTLDGLGTLSAERVGAEIKALLSLADPSPSVATMEQAGVLARILPGATTTALAPLVHLEGDAPPNPIRRLAALGGEHTADRLRLSRAETKALDILRDGIGSGDEPGALGYRHGYDAARDILMLRAVFASQPLADDALHNARAGSQAAFPVTAADLMDRFEGKALGDALRDLEARWIASGFTLTRDDLL
ncbi:MAG: CCA tRNA nucleotidyltransferase [Pseudomonadota bacterium]